MKNIYKVICIYILTLCASGQGYAQELPLLPPDPSVSGGTLPNGMSFYVVANPTSRGLADFALVQKTGTETVPQGTGERVVSVAKDALASLPRLSGESLQAYLARHGVTPGKDGFVKVSESATIYHFENVVISEGDAAVDSTLLMLMDIADRGSTGDDAFLNRWYAPSDQAIVVSGDVSPEMVIGRLKIMSMMTPSRLSQERKEYVWQSSEEPVFETSPYFSRKIATVSATWASPRTPKEYMNTIQPAIYEMFMNELGIIARERLRQMLRNDGVPVADISYSHLDSVRSLGDESFTVSVSVAPEHAEKAVAALAQVMSSLDSGHAQTHELEMAKRRYIAMVTERSEEPLKSNSEYVDRCAAAFLYNAPLSSDREMLAFLKSRDLDAETELRLFDNVASALIDNNRNLTVECSTSGGFEMDTAFLKDVFMTAWEKDAGMACVAPPDSLPLPGPGEKVGLRSTRKEPMSGGVIWTFENGFRVVYKRCDTGRRLHYSLALNGGYGNIRNLSKGEGAYMKDYFDLYRVAGMSGEEFRLALEMKDMTMDSQVNLSNTIISGSLPESGVDLLMGALLAVANRRSPDPEPFEYYRDCAALSFEYARGSVSDRTAAIDSLMCPDYIYSPLKSPGKMTDGFVGKADAFFDAQMNKMNDGLLVLMGNMEETRLRKLLQLYVGGFVTTDRTFPRTVVHYQPVSGACTYTSSGKKDCADIVMSVRLPLTADNYMATILAVEVLRQTVSEALDGTGTYIRISHNCRIYPEERFNVMITMEPASADGFATGTELTGFDVAIDCLREALGGLSETEVPEETLARYKGVLKGHMEMITRDTEYRMHAMTMRYLDGKDLTTGYEARIDAVSAPKVREILSSLTNASKVEYITRKR